MTIKYKAENITLQLQELPSLYFINSIEQTTTSIRWYYMHYSLHIKT